MRKNIFRILLVAIAIGFGSTSCVENDSESWTNSYLDINNTYTTDYYGNFGNPFYDYDFRDLGNVSQSDNVLNIELKDTWIEIYSNFQSGDMISNLTISINGVGNFVCPTYYVNGYYSKIVIDDAIAPGLYNFMSNAFRKMAYTGRLTVSINGNYNVRNAYLNVTLKNDLDVLIQQTW